MLTRLNKLEENLKNGSIKVATVESQNNNINAVKKSINNVESKKPTQTNILKKL